MMKLHVSTVLCVTTLGLCLVSVAFVDGGGNTAKITTTTTTPKPQGKKPVTDLCSGGTSSNAAQQALATATKTTVMNVLATNVGLSQTCVQKRISDLKVAQIDCANATVAAKAVCNYPFLLDTVQSCVSTANRCQLLLQLYSGSCTVCPASKQAVVSRMLSIRCNMSPVNVSDVLMTATMDQIQTYLLDLINSNALTTLANGSFPMAKFALLSCDKQQSIGTLIRANDIVASYTARLLGVSTVVMFQLLSPYYSRQSCTANLPTITSANFVQLTQLPFACSSSGGGNSGNTQTASASAQTTCVQLPMTTTPSTDTSKSCDMPCGNILMQALVRANNISSSMIPMLGNLSGCLPKSFVMENAKPGQCANFGAGVVPTDSRALKALADKCKTSNNTKNFTSSDVSKMGCSVLGADRRMLETIPQSSMCQANISMCFTSADQIPKPLSDTMARVCGGNKIDSDKVRQLGKAVVYASRSALRNMSAADMSNNDVKQAMKDGLDDMRKQGDPTRAAKAYDIAKKMNLSDAANSADLMQVTSKSAFAQKIVNHSVDDIRASLGPNPALTDGQRRTVCKAAQSALNISDVTTTDPDTLKKLGDFIHGLLGAELANMSAADMPSVLRALCSYSNWRGAQLIGLRRLLNDTLLDLNPNNMLAGLPSLINDLDATCLMRINETTELPELAKNGTGCADICTKLGAAPSLHANVPVEQRRKLASVCFDCVVAIDLPTDGQVNLTELVKLGYLVSDLNATVLGRVPADVIKAQVNAFRRIRCLTDSALAVIKAKLASVIYGNETSDDLVSLGAIGLISASDAAFSALKATYADITSTIILDFNATDNALKAEDKACDSYNKRKTGNKNYVNPAVKTVQDRILQANNITVSGRRRRQTTSSTLQCSDIQAMGSLVVQLPDRILTGMAPDEFYSCISTFGLILNWTPAQQQMLLTTALVSMSYRTVCDMTSRDLQTLGTLAYAMTVTNITCLKNAGSLDDDAINALGSLPDWGTAQAKVFLSAFMTRYNDMSSITDWQLVNLGYFLCVVDPTEVRKINPTAYGSVSSFIGQLAHCDPAVLAALKYVATQVYGPVNTWDSSIFNDVGIVLGGLSTDELANVPQGAIEGWQLNGIAALSVKQVTSLSYDQLISFCPDQALAVPDDVYNQLDEIRQTILYLRGLGADIYMEAGMAPNGDTPVSSAVHGGFSLIITLFFAAITTIVVLVT